jgi:Tfp pilus assembly protein PilE
VVLAVLACVVFLGYRTYTRKKNRKAEGEKPAEGQGTPS